MSIALHESSLAKRRFLAVRALLESTIAIFEGAKRVFWERCAISPGFFQRFFRWKAAFQYRQQPY